MTSRQLASLSRYWITRLGLDHWQFIVQFADQGSLSDDPDSFYFGKCYPDLNTMTAHIWVSNERDIPDDVVRTVTLCPKDRRAIIEQTLIHELLHARLDPTMVMKNDTTFESGIDHVASALWALGGKTRT